MCICHPSVCPFPSSTHWMRKSATRPLFLGQIWHLVKMFGFLSLAFATITINCASLAPVDKDM